MKIEIENVGITNSVSSLCNDGTVDVKVLCERSMFNPSVIMSELKYFIEHDDDYLSFIKNEASKMLTIIEVGRKLRNINNEQ